MIRAMAPKVGDHAGGEKMVLEPPMNSAGRRKLGNITNLLMNQGVKQQKQAVLVSSKENAENLQKENVRLMKVVVERDGVKSELQKLRIKFQQVKAQNLLLAQANTRLLTEFNTSKDQLKILHHELGCKNGLVMARKILLKEQTLPCTRHASKVKPIEADHENVSESSNTNSFQINEKPNNKRRISERKNPAALDIIGRLGEACQTGDNIDNKKFSDGNSAPDKADFVLDAENHINDNVQSKRCCIFKIETGQSVKLQKVVDAKEIKGDARFPLRRRSARLKSQEPDPSESLHESIETARRRRSAIGLQDDQAIATNAGCSASEQSTGSNPEAVEPNNLADTTGKSRVSSRIQSAHVKSQRHIKETADPPLHDDIVDQSSPISCTVSMEVKGESKNKPAGDESEEMRKTTVGRPSRKAADKIKSYKEPSLRDKMRGGF